MELQHGSSRASHCKFLIVDSYIKWFKLIGKKLKKVSKAYHCIGAEAAENPNSSIEPNWANLDALALSLILENLEEPIDHIWFGAVCKNWCSIAKIHHQYRQFKSNVLPPMLMFHTKRETNFYSIPGERSYSFQSLEFPMPQFRWCCGFHHGWFATLNSKSGRITVRNPFKNVAPIHLPPQSYKRLNSFWKVILSSDPITSPNDYVVAAIDDEWRISFIRAGQKCWTYINVHLQTPDIYNREHCFTTIAFYKGLIYAVNLLNNIVSFDPSSKEKIVPDMVLQGSYDHDINYNSFYSTSNYLVESLEGDLWMVKRGLNAGGTCLQVYKLEQNGKLVQLKSLGDNVLFVKNLVSFSVSASYFSNCLQKDSIYFNLQFDFGSQSAYFTTYNVKDERFHRHFCGGTPPLKEQPFSLWIQPPFQWD